MPGLSLAFHTGDETVTAIVAGRGAEEVIGTRTFLFADLRDFTASAERHGDDAAGALVADYRALVREELARQGGVEVSTEGDSLFAVFKMAFGLREP